jgi:outer membrane protein TolC
MKRLYPIIAVVAGLITSNAIAQEAAPKVFTLQQCIDYALENAVSAQNAKIDEQIAQAKVKETIGIGLPQVDGSASVQHNQQLRRFFGTYIANPGAGDFTFFPPGIEGAEDGDVLAAQSPFQLKSSGDAGLTINQIIFNGSYVIGLQASKAYKDLSVKSSIQTREQIIQQVTKAYYAVLINRERSELFMSNIARVDTLLRNTRALFQNGFAESIDADRVQVTLNNLIVEQDKFLSLNELGIELLKFQMNYPMNESLDVQGNIEDVQVQVDIEVYKENWSYSTRPDYQLLEANKRLQELNVRNQYAQSLPSLSAFANLGYATQSSNVSGIFKTNSGAKDDGTYGPDKWYPYSLFGVSLNVPIFSGLQRNYRVQQEKLSLQKIKNNFVSLESSIDLEIKRASVTYENALRTLTAQQQNTELAGKVARVTKIKYEQGVGSNIEVIDAEDSLRQAQTNYYNALFDAMIARVDLEKAYGKLIPETQTK